MKKLISLSILVIIFCLNLQAQKNSFYTILISFDAFRYDFTDKGLTPKINSFAVSGVKALSLKPVFPSKTFPNHISIMTGCYPQKHGIISNHFKNLSNNKMYKVGDTASVKNKDWYKAEFFWETIQKNNIKAASVFWPGSEINDIKKRPLYFNRYNQKTAPKTRVDTLISWLKLPYAARPKFLSIYFEDTDTKGHKYGPESLENRNAIKKLDDVFGYILSEISKTGIRDSVNIILLSDHGMTDISAERTINIKNIIGDFSPEINGSGTMMGLKVSKSLEDSVYNILKKSENHFDCYKKEEMSGYFNYSSNNNILPIQIVAHPGWSLINGELNKSEEEEYNAGDHGYDNSFLDMHGIFIASGPSFKKNYKTGTLRNIDIYPLLCKLFGIECKSDIDGNIDEIGFILNSTEQ